MGTDLRQMRSRRPSQTEQHGLWTVRVPRGKRLRGRRHPLLDTNHIAAARQGLFQVSIYFGTETL